MGNFLTSSGLPLEGSEVLPFPLGTLAGPGAQVLKAQFVTDIWGHLTSACVDSLEDLDSV